MSPNSQLGQTILLFPNLKLLSEEVCSFLICQNEREQHGVDHDGDGEVGQVGVLGLVLHEADVKHRGEDESQGVDQVQSFETYRVLYLWRSMKSFLEHEEDLDAQRSDKHEDGIDDLDENPKVEEGLVPIVGLCVGKICLKFRKRRIQDKT